MTLGASLVHEELDLGLAIASEALIDHLFRLILQRPVGNPAWLTDHGNKYSIEYWIKRLLYSEEFRAKFLSTHNIKYSDGDGRKELVFDEETLCNRDITSSAVDKLFQIILRRSVGSEKQLAEIDRFGSVSYWVQRLVNSDEFKHRFLSSHGLALLTADRVSDADFRTPNFKPPRLPAAVLLVGSCMTESWASALKNKFDNVAVRHQLFNNASALEDISTESLQGYAFQITQIPIRSIIHEAEYMGLEYSQEGEKRMEATFAQACTRLKKNLNASLKYNQQAGITVFVLNFSCPQANPHGFLLKKFSWLNPWYFVSKLNECLEQLASENNGVHVVDWDAIASSLGKRYLMDDFTTHWNHGSFLGPTNTSNDIDLTPYGSIDEIFGQKTSEAVEAIFNETVHQWGILDTQISKVKIVIFDLDGTLWRGVAADADYLGAYLTEGWPLGILDAASYLKARGVLLAIASKNDAYRVKEIWNELYEKRFSLDNFVSVQCSWEQKTDGVKRILAETNLLPESALFVDDNPLERKRVRDAFPTMQVIDGPIVEWRRKLLWGLELQAPYVTAEAALRTQSIKNSVLRRSELGSDSPSGTLEEDLQVSVTLSIVSKSSDRKFNRAFELLNKTNQFNTTGVRWPRNEIEQYLNAGGRILTANVSDRFSDYGTGIVLLFDRGMCSQICMSCRVFGLHVEYAVFQAFLSVSERFAKRSVLATRTARNELTRSFYREVGINAPVVEVGVSESLPIPQGAKVQDSLLAGVAILGGGLLEAFGTG